MAATMSSRLNVLTTPIHEPKLKWKVETVDLSVRRNNLGIGQAIDLAGEQSYMKNAKTAGKFVKKV